MDSVRCTPGERADEGHASHTTITEAAEPPLSCKKYSGSALPGLSYTEFLRIRDELPTVLGDARWAQADTPAPTLARLVSLGHDRLPLPGTGAGIAACWYGGARSLADSVRRACAERPEPFRLAHLGAIDVAMSQAAALLREAAAWIDAHPRDNAMAVALRVRAAAESAAATVLDHAGRALGAAPYCRDAGFARMAADLPVFVRESHADRDLAALAQTLATSEETIWAL